MGCDIHLLLEEQHEIDGKGPVWVGYKVPRARRDLCGRNYRFFALLAGVRGDGPNPSGIPPDASHLALSEIQRWGISGHSHGSLSTEEFIARSFDAGTEFPESNMAARALTGKYSQGLLEEVYSFISDVTDSDGGYPTRMVFWFDN